MLGLLVRPTPILAHFFPLSNRSIPQPPSPSTLNQIGITPDAKINHPSPKTAASLRHSSNNSQPSANLPPRFSHSQIALVAANVSLRVIFPFRAAKWRKKVAHGASRGFMRLSLLAPAGAAEGLCQFEGWAEAELARSRQVSVLTIDTNEFYRRSRLRPPLRFLHSCVPYKSTLPVSVFHPWPLHHSETPPLHFPNWFQASLGYFLVFRPPA